MANIVNHLLLACLIFSPLGSFAEEANVRWYEGDLKSALQVAKNKGYPVFAVFYMPWCGPSHYLLNSTLKDKELVDYVNGSSIPIKLDGEEFPELFEKYGVYSYPSVLTLRYSGEEVDRVGGAGDSPEDMHAAYRNVIDNEKSPVELLLELQKIPLIQKSNIGFQ